MLELKEGKGEKLPNFTVPTRTIVSAGTGYSLAEIDVRRNLDFIDKFNF